jgi:hypothetical protein
MALAGWGRLSGMIAKEAAAVLTSPMAMESVETPA